VSVRLPARFALVFAGLVLFLGIATTATNVVPSSRADTASASRPTANQLKPPACAALNLQAVSTSGGGGGGLSTLILGGPGNDNLVGASGNDCIVGGGGDDKLNGNSGTDVCIGGPGNDTFHQSCETQIQ
jgi:RTX calcium-binding nonapeptide repeat (4 copies)